MSESTRLSYGAARTAWGRIWVAVSPGGVARVALGSAPVGKLSEELRARHPARLVHDPRAVAGLLARLAAYLRGELREIEDEPDYSGLSDFQTRVFEAARRVPYGRRTSYQSLARRVSSPRHAHAVGAILARNPFRLLVPDHRVVLAGGEPGGYGAGAGWKRRLLSLESGQRALDWEAVAGRPA